MPTSNQPSKKSRRDEVSRQIADLVESDAVPDFGCPPHPADEAPALPPGDWIPERFGPQEPITEEPPEWFTAPPIFDDNPDGFDLPETSPAAAPPAPPIRKEPDDETLAACAALDQSDTDNAKRLVIYFPDELLIMQAAGIAGGDKLDLVRDALGHGQRRSRRVA